jgi:hypothetical protein
MKHDHNFCFGEELKNRQSKYFNVIGKSIEDGLFNIQASGGVYCISMRACMGYQTKPFSRASFYKMHEFIRETVRKTYEAISQKMFLFFMVEV